jgi:hypothetical protein
MTGDDTAQGAGNPIADCAAQASTAMHRLDIFHAPLLPSMN